MGAADRPGHLRPARQAPIVTTSQLVAVIDAAIPKKFREKDGSHPARRVFQALRIAVNDELDPLSRSIRDAGGSVKAQAAAVRDYLPFPGGSRL